MTFFEASVPESSGRTLIFPVTLTPDDFPNETASRTAVSDDEMRNIPVSRF